jgi:hypothetical protein
VNAPSILDARGTRPELKSSDGEVMNRQAEAAAPSAQPGGKSDE